MADALVEPPEGFTYAACPTLEQHRELIGRKVLVAHERKKNLEAGWYIGTMKLSGAAGRPTPPPAPDSA